MSEPIFDPAYWKERIETAQVRGEIHQAVFICGGPHWEEIQAHQRKVLAHYIKPGESVLDVGCGFGRLISLFNWSTVGSYVGMDLSPDLIRIAEDRYPYHSFLVGDMRAIPLPSHGMDWAVAVGVRRMVVRYVGQSTWDGIQAELLRVANKVLVMEYDEQHEGSEFAEIEVLTRSE